MAIFFFTGLPPCVDSRHILDFRNIMYYQPPPCVEGRCAPSGIAPSQIDDRVLYWSVCCYLWAGLMTEYYTGACAATYRQD